MLTLPKRITKAGSIAPWMAAMREPRMMRKISSRVAKRSRRVYGTGLAFSSVVKCEALRPLTPVDMLVRLGTGLGMVLSDFGALSSVASSYAGKFEDDAASSARGMEIFVSDMVDEGCGSLDDSSGTVLGSPTKLKTNKRLINIHNYEYEYDYHSNN